MCVHGLIDLVCRRDPVLKTVMKRDGVNRASWLLGRSSGYLVYVSI
jgi:hypothetical protein